MDDLISRQEAINRIESHIRALDGGEVYPLTETDKAINYALEVAASCVYNLPSAQPEHLQTVMKKIKEKYEKGMNTPSINKPMAWALYETWKEYDR